MTEVNRELAGLAEHKYQIGDTHVWADSQEQAEKRYREYIAGVLYRCDPKALRRADNVHVPPVTIIY